MSKNGKTGQRTRRQQTPLKIIVERRYVGTEKWKRYSNGATYSNYPTEGGGEDNRKAKNGSSCSVPWK